MNHNVKKISMTLELDDGRKSVVEFIRPEKITDLLADKGSLGAFLRDWLLETRDKNKR